MNTPLPHFPSDCKVGLLPLYLELYDQTLPKLREELFPFLQTVENTLRGLGVELYVAPVCCTRSDCMTAIAQMNHNDCDVVISLHLAYSPSLEAADAYCQLNCPLIFLDTTPDKGFGLDVDPMRLLYNHGIHGLQDLTSVLHRRRRQYWIVAGHLSDGRTISNLCELMRGCFAARQFQNQQVVRIGAPFIGMGDFQVEEELLRDRFGIAITTIHPELLKEVIQSVSEHEITEEAERDYQSFTGEVTEAVHHRSLRLGLGVRQWLEHHHSRALSMNFLAFDSPYEPLSTVPFLECCKAMQRGLGYAGEGDVLTAALVGALQRSFGQTTFTEIFCPDWVGNSLFLSHMGEVNPQCAQERPLLYEKEFPFTPAQNPVTLACAIREGPATFVNLAPGPEGTWNLIVAPVEMLGDGIHPDLRHWIRGWMQPQFPITDFLERFSLAGGTHHSALILGNHVSGVLTFGQILGFKCTVEQ